MAFGSHMLNGQIADLEKAPQRMSRAAISSRVEEGGGEARISEIR